jgi:hypothetical protein
MPEAYQVMNSGNERSLLHTRALTLTTPPLSSKIGLIPDWSRLPLSELPGPFIFSPEDIAQLTIESPAYAGSVGVATFIDCTMFRDSQILLRFSCYERIRY